MTIGKYLVLLLFLFVATAHADVTVYGKAPAKIQSALDSMSHSLNAQGKDVHLSVGRAGFKEALDNTAPETLIYATLITETAYRSIISEYPDKKTVALFADPEPLSNSVLAQNMLGTNVNVGYLLTSNTAYLIPRLEQAKVGYTLLSSYSVRDVVTAMAEFDAVVLVPDELIYTRHSLPSILQSALRQHIPLIGYTRSHV